MNDNDKRLLVQKIIDLDKLIAIFSKRSLICRVIYNNYRDFYSKMMSCSDETHLKIVLMNRFFKQSEHAYVIRIHELKKFRKEYVDEHNIYEQKLGTDKTN